MTLTCSLALARPPIHVLGTVDLLLVETTPLVIDGKLWRFESVRPEYWDNRQSTGPTGSSYLRLVDVASGSATVPFGLNHGLGCAVYDEATSTVYAYATSADSSSGGNSVVVFWSIDGMKTWQNKTAIDFAKRKKKVYNTSVDKGKLKGKDVWVMSYETAIAGTPGMWNTAFGIADSPVGPWTVLDDSVFRMPLNVEHADPALRYVEADGYWYCLTARRSPAGQWYFFMEIYRSKDLQTWEVPLCPSLLCPPLVSSLSPLFLSFSFVYCVSTSAGTGHGLCKLHRHAPSQPKRNARSESGTRSCKRRGCR